MKTKITLLLFFFASSFLHAQDTIRMQAKSGGYNREYLMYLPKSYNPEKPSGLIVCLHGFNRTMEDFFSKYPIAPIADSLNLVVLAPQALPEQDPKVIEAAEVLAGMGLEIPLDAAWGCGLQVQASLGTPSKGIVILDEELNKPVNDVAFIKQIVDETTAKYNIKAENRFIFGTSMGGFMSYQYAMNHGNELAGLVSIAGSMGTNMKDTAASVSLPICDFHSLTDETVPYGGSIIYTAYTIPLMVTLSQEKYDVINFWVGKDKANPKATIKNVDYYPSTNGISVKKYTYSGENEVIHYQMNGSSHDYYFKKANGDCMDYDEEVIKFLSAHITKDGTGISSVYSSKLAVYPNPVENQCTVQGTQSSADEIHVYNITGRLVGAYKAQDGATTINMTQYTKGIYLLKYEGKTVKVIKK